MLRARMEMTLGLVTDLHFGPRACFEGKLRKLSHEAPRLAEDVVAAMNDVVRPDLFVNLGDDIEDESREADLARYLDCQRILRGARAPLINVAGNHDTVHLGAADLVAAWGRTGNLHYAFDQGPLHFVVLHTVERKDVDVRIDEGQLAWLAEDLRATRLPVVVLMHHPASEQDLGDSRWFSRAAHIALVRERAELRRILSESKKVRLVVNGHVHRNHLDMIGGIPFVTVQSLIENLDDDAPGRPAASYAEVRLTDTRTLVTVHGNDPARYQIELGP